MKVNRKVAFTILALVISGCSTSVSTLNSGRPEIKSVNESKENLSFSTKALTQYNVTTFAGSTIGFADANGVNAKFSNPRSVATDTTGNVYVADVANNKIRKITPSGVVTTLAGSGTLGYADGTGSLAMFNSPRGVAVDTSGNVYVTDLGNYKIRKVTPSGVVTTLAGSTNGFLDGNPTNAMFSLIEGIAVDSGGNVFVADFGNNRIRKINTSGVVSTFAGGISGYADGNGTFAKFKLPYGIAIDTGGNLFVTDNFNSLIRKITSSGVVSTLAGVLVPPVYQNNVMVTPPGGYADGNATSALFSFPRGIAVDSVGNVYVSGDRRVRRIDNTPNHVVTTIAGSISGYQDGNGLSALFYTPDGLAVDPTGNIYVSDIGNQKIRKIKKITKIVEVITAPIARLIGPASYTGTSVAYNQLQLKNAIGTDRGTQDPYINGTMYTAATFNAHYVEDGQIYNVTENGYKQGYVLIIDNSDELNPAVVAKIGMSGAEFTMAYSSGNDLFITGSDPAAPKNTNIAKQAFVMKYDVSDPENPIYKGIQYLEGRNAVSIHSGADGNMVVATGQSGKLYEIDSDLGIVKESDNTKKDLRDAIWNGTEIMAIDGGYTDAAWGGSEIANQGTSTATTGTAGNTPYLISNTNAFNAFTDIETLIFTPNTDNIGENGSNLAKASIVKIGDTDKYALGLSEGGIKIVNSAGLALANAPIPGRTVNHVYVSPDANADGNYMIVASAGYNGIEFFSFNPANNSLQNVGSQALNERVNGGDIRLYGASTNAFNFAMYTKSFPATDTPFTNRAGITNVDADPLGGTITGVGAGNSVIWINNSPFNLIKWDQVNNASVYHVNVIDITDVSAQIDLGTVDFAQTVLEENINSSDGIFGLSSLGTPITLVNNHNYKFTVTADGTDPASGGDKNYRAPFGIVANGVNGATFGLIKPKTATSGTGAGLGYFSN